VRHDAAVESASSEIGAIAGAIEELQSRLERANEQLGQVSAVQTTEFEIGRLFMEAQRSPKHVVQTRDADTGDPRRGRSESR